MTKEDKYYQVEVETTANLENLKYLIATESDYNPFDMVIYYKSQALIGDGKRLDDFEICNNDMLSVGLMTKDFRDKSFSSSGGYSMRSGQIQAEKQPKCQMTDK